MYDHYQALIFDCDGTLVDSLYAHEAAWSEVLTYYQIPFEGRRMNQLGGVPTAETIEILTAEAGITVDVAAVARAKEERFQEIAYDGLREIKPIVDIARRYYGKLPLGVATGSATPVARTILAALRIDYLFNTIVGADDVSRHKPAPDVYLEAARRLGIDPQRCCAFDDADGGVLAAQNAGMAVVDVREIWLPENRLFKI